MSKKRYIAELIREKLRLGLAPEYIESHIDTLFPGINLTEMVLVPWHKTFPKITEQLQRPSTIYSPVIYEAQGGVDGEVRVPIIANAHVSGGGIPLKGKRMIGNKNIGLDLESVFPDPEGVAELMELALQHPKADGSLFVNNRGASEQWNRGVGFISVTETEEHADELIRIAASQGRVAAKIGKTTNKRKIRWHGEEWTF